MQASTCCVPRNQEHISHRSSVIANFLLKFSNFRYLGNMGWSETNFTYTVKFADSENPLLGARIRNISPIEALFKVTIGCNAIFHIFGWKIGKHNFFIIKTIKRTWVPPGRVIWSVNSDDQSTGPTCSDAHETYKRIRVTISRMRRHVPFDELIVPNTCACGVGSPTQSTVRNFLKIDPRVLVLADPEIWHFPLTLLVVLTTLTLLCERVIIIHRVPKRGYSILCTPFGMHHHETQRY